MEESEARTLDLSLLWEVIDKHRQEKEGQEESNSKWELVVIQAVLLTLLILVAIIWAFCCRRNCCRPGQDQLSVAEALRKISRDLPPSYSKVSHDQSVSTVTSTLYCRPTSGVSASASTTISTLPPPTSTSSRTASSTSTWSRATTGWPSSASVTRTGQLPGWRG